MTSKFPDPMVGVPSFQHPALPPLRLKGAPPLKALFSRLAGPGGLYNAGNAIGLAGGVSLAVAASGGSDGPDVASGLTAAADYLAGGADAIAISAAMLVFFWGGEVYHRAWSKGAPPDASLNRRGDLLSGYGALLLGLGLFLMGQPLLAASSGLLHAFGKFASVWHGSRKAGPEGWPDLFRSTVLVSRLPALLLVTTDLGNAILHEGGTSFALLSGPALLLSCYLIWARADLMLLRSQ